MTMMRRGRTLGSPDLCKRDAEAARRRSSLGSPRLNALTVAFALALAVGCGTGQEDSVEAPVVGLTVDTLVDTESGLIAYAADMDVSPSGVLYVADFQADQIVRIDPRTRETTRIGRSGEGPGELDEPWAIKALADELWVVDRGNGRVQVLSESGIFLGTRPVTGWVRAAAASFTADGGLVLGSRGQDSSLVVVFDSAATEVRRVGTPVVTPPPFVDIRAVKAAILEGEIPDDLRNEVLAATDDRGRTWVALQTEGEIRRYGVTGDLELSVTVDEPEMEAARAFFFRRNEERKDGRGYTSLRYFQDVTVVGGALWILLHTQPDGPAVVLVIGPEGEEARRIEISGAGGAAQMAVDGTRGRLFLYTADDAQLLQAKLP